MDRLVVDIDQLDSLAARLSRPLSALKTEDIRVEVVADLVGHDGLAQRIRDFGKGWDDNRSKLIERVDGVHRSIAKIGEQFASLETELQTSIDGSADQGGTR